jgi:hypothetical protein
MTRGLPEQSAREPGGAGIRKAPYRIPLMLHNLSPTNQVECTMEKEVHRHKKWFSDLEYRMAEIEEQLGERSRSEIKPR